MDFIIMVKGTSNMFICGPDVIQLLPGQKMHDGRDWESHRQCQCERQRPVHRRK
jgi:hypothetical protein